MASVDRSRALSADRLRTAIPCQRGSAEQERIRADDQLIEAIRTGRIDRGTVDPLARMLIEWRLRAVEGT